MDEEDRDAALGGANQPESEGISERMEFGRSGRFFGFPGVEVFGGRDGREGDFWRLAGDNVGGTVWGLLVIIVWGTVRMWMDKDPRRLW